MRIFQIRNWNKSQKCDNVTFWNITKCHKLSHAFKSLLQNYMYLQSYTVLDFAQNACKISISLELWLFFWKTEVVCHDSVIWCELEHFFLENLMIGACLKNTPKNWNALSGALLKSCLTPVKGPIVETKNRAIFLERFFGRGITAREQLSRAVILARF